MGAPQRSREVRLQVLAQWALTGNASEVARQHDLPGSTVRRWVSDAQNGKDEEGKRLLGEHGQNLRARAIDTIERAFVGGVLDTAVSRINDPAWALHFKSDPTSNLLNAVGNIYGRLLDADRLQAERAGELRSGPQVVFVTDADAASPPAGDKPGPGP